MSMLLKNIFRPLYNYFKSSYEREFYRLYSKYGNMERYRKIENLRFLEYSIDVVDFISFVWQFREIFVEEIYKFNPSNNQPVIFDCGANIGISCLYFKRIYPNARIIAFEADPYIAEYLKRNLAKNGLKDIEIVDKAVWINDNGVMFGIEGADGGSIKLPSDDKIKVESVRLKHLLKKEPIIDLLKIDIEGAEYEVLKDCKNSLSNVFNLFVEFHSWSNLPQNLSEILSILENNGFRYYIENVSKHKKPFINHGKNLNLDLQLNIYGIKCAKQDS